MKLGVGVCAGLGMCCVNVDFIIIVWMTQGGCACGWVTKYKILNGVRNK